MPKMGMPPERRSYSNAPRQQVVAPGTDISNNGVTFVLRPIAHAVAIPVV